MAISSEEPRSLTKQGVYLIEIATEAHGILTMTDGENGCE